MRFVYSFLIICICSSYGMFSQQISVDNSVGLQQLIEDNFVQGCVEISNISSTVNGAAFGINSYGAFNKAGSNFPLNDGIILSTGNANSAGNSIISNALSDSSTLWGTDIDIETATGLNNTTNATSIEFDFVSAYNQLEFNYIFASEEYVDDNACSSGDSFVILIKEAGSTGPYQNIALIPNTSTPITVSNIRDEINASTCPAQNSQYFDDFTQGDTNFEGRTTILNASTTIIPQTTYHIKLIIADQPDGNFDSAVFIQSNSFNTSVDLGPDINTCSSETLLNVLKIPSATYQWYHNNSLIPNAESSSYNATENGTYRVVLSLPLNGKLCSEEDEIIVSLNTEPIIPQGDPFPLCDNPSNGIGEETFILNQHDSIINNISPFNNTSITYHESDQDARNLNNSGITTANNSTTPVIFVRLHDLDNDCYAYTNFNLVVNSLPTIVMPSNLPVCDEDDDLNGITIINLSIKDDEITGNQTHLEVTYHTTSIGAVNGDDSIPDKTSYINTNTTGETIFVRVTDTNTMCVTAPIPLVLNMNVAPTVNTTDPVFIDACDRDLDGFDSFNLESVIPDIVGSLTDYTPYFYENRDDALEGNNNFIQAPLDPTNYTNTIRNGDELGIQTMFIRIEDINTGCASVVPFEIHTNLLLTGTELIELALCDDDADNTTPLNFNLLAVENTISNDLPDPVNVTFYANEDDRTNDIPINENNDFPVTSPVTLFITLEDGNCTEESEITLRVNPTLTFEPVNPISICDTDSDGLVDVNLHDLDDIVTNRNPDFSVTYFPTFNDADINNIDTRLNSIKDATGTIDIHARIASTTLGISCATVSSFKITIFPAPATNTPEPAPICDTVDGDPNGYSDFNLNTIIDDLVPNPTGLNIQFFKTRNAANIGDATNTNPDWIPTKDWDSFNTNTQEIFARIEDPNSGLDCNPYAIESFFIYVNTEPIIAVDLELKVCKSSNTTTAPDIILEDYDSLILGNQTGKEVLYFYDANFLTPIPKTTPIPSFNGDIFIRVENITDRNGCIATARVPLVILDNPSYDPITRFTICEVSTNVNYFFNLEDKADEIRASSTEILNITFHKLEDNAKKNIQDITDSDNYPGTDNETIYVRIERDDTKCTLVEPLKLVVFIRPETTKASPYNQCDYDSDPYNGETKFDLTSVRGNYFEIKDRFQNNIDTHYFKELEDINQNNGLDNSKAIPNDELSEYISETTTIYIKVANIITGCFDTLPLQLNVVAPPIFNTNIEIPECYNTNNTYNLAQANNLLVTNPTDYNFTYSTNENNASINVDTFSYTIPGDYIIDVEIEDKTTPNCISITSFLLQIVPNPVANTAPDLIHCDNNHITNDTKEINIAEYEDIILGTQNTSMFTVDYYNDYAQANAKIPNTPPLNKLYLASNNETIYARIENTNTGCFDITQFNIKINPLPLIPINNVVPLCGNDLPLVIDAYTGNPNDTYLWSTGATTSQIVLNDASEIGNYWVTATTPNIIGSDCEYTHNFSVIESQQAEINFTTTVDFADPNSITVNVSGIGNYVYILDDGNPQTSNVFENVTFGVHTVTIRDLNGCNDATTEVVVIDIPKFMTPNNDGTFDTWHIIGIQEIPGTVVYIFNRHGKLLKTLPHTSIGWDGTFNGQNMPSDDYWFVAKVIQNGEAFDIKGHFTLKR